MNSESIEKLCCPESHGTLVHVAAGIAGPKELLYCQRSGRTYPIENGVPVLLSEEATILDKEACAALDERLAEIAS